MDGCADIVGPVQSGEQFTHTRQRRNKGVDFVFGVVERKRSACGRGHAEVLHQRMCAMMAGAHRDAFVVKQGGDVMRVRTFDHKRKHRDAIGGFANQAQTIDVA